MLVWDDCAMVQKLTFYDMLQAGVSESYQSCCGEAVATRLTDAASSSTTQKRTGNAWKNNTERFKTAAVGSRTSSTIASEAAFDELHRLVGFLVSAQLQELCALPRDLFIVRQDEQGHEKYWKILRHCATKTRER